MCKILGFKVSTMSSQLASEHVCYVHCNFCNTILAVNVLGNNYLLNIVTVRCGHCANLLSVNVGSLLQGLPLQDFQNHQIASQGSRGNCSSTSKYKKASVMTFSEQHYQQKMLPIHPPEKRQRVPSAYNRFIKEEIQRIKANNPDISHRKAFSAAAKNWAHLPRMHFGLSLIEGNNGKQAQKIDEVAARGKSLKVCFEEKTMHAKLS